MKDANGTRIQPNKGEAWSQAERAYIHRLLAFVLRDEAESSPSLGPWVETLLSRPGKMLRPRLVLAGARLARAHPSPGAQGVQGGPGAAYGPGLAPELGTDAELAALREAFKTGLRARQIPLEPIPAFEAWKEKSPFPGGLSNRIYLLALAIEILHLASLAHDDVIDASRLRRGQGSAPAILGSSGAVLAGDLLLTLCFTLVNEGASGPVAQSLSGMVRLMVRSELSQAADRRRFDAILSGAESLPGRRQYLRTIGGKTALLFSMALATGAAEQGLRGSLLKEIEALGFCMGIAFQIVDDLLDLEAAAAFGKEAGQDLRDAQLTLPLIHALKRDRDHSLARAIQAFRAGEAPLKAVRDILTERDSLNACRREIDTWRSRAYSHLATLKRSPLPPQALTELEELLVFAIERER